MAIQFMEDFRSYGLRDTSRISDGSFWNNIGPSTVWGILPDPDPLAMPGSRCLEPRIVAPLEAVNFIVPVPSSNLGVCHRSWFEALPASGYPASLFNLTKVGGTSIVSLDVNTNGSLTLTVNGSPAVSTNRPIILTNRWQHVELLIDTVAGSIEVRFEGIAIPELSYTIPDSVSQTIAHVYFGRANNASTFKLKDFIVWDKTGSAPGNTFMGPVTLYDCTPAGDQSSGWSRSSGTQDYPLVNEAGPPDDSTYLYAGESPIPAPSRMTLQSLPDDVVAVRGVMTLVRARKVDGGDGNLQVSLVSGSDKNSGTDRPVTTAFSYWSDVFATDPSTGLAWTPQAVNDAVIELDRKL